MYNWCNINNRNIATLMSLQAHAICESLYEFLFLALIALTGIVSLVLNLCIILQ